MMTRIPSFKYYFAALAVGVGAWVPIVTGVPVGLTVLSLLAGCIMAAIVLEKSPVTRSGGASLEGLWTSERTRPKRVLVVGAGKVGRELAERMESTGRYEIVGFADDGVKPGGECDWPLLGSRDAVERLVSEFDVDEVCLAYAPSWQQHLIEELTERHPEVRVRVVPSSYEALLRIGQVESFGDIAVVRLSDGAARSREWAKRTFDVAASLAGLVVGAPVMLLAALLIKVTSPGPALFAQQRVGRYGRIFTLYKFRTMVIDAEAHTGPVLANGRDDVRLTSLGRWLRFFRVDELPQLWNVLRGEMSLVGPRPERPHFVRQFERTIPAYSRRHQVRPGITGLAQVCAGYHTDFRDKLRFDLIYVSHHSLWLDLAILFRTISVCCRGSR